MKYGKKGMAAGGITNMGPTNMSIKGFGMSNKPKPRTGEMQVVREAERAQQKAVRDAERAQRKAARDAEKAQRKAATKAKVEQLTAKSTNRRADMAKIGAAPKPTPLPMPMAKGGAVMKKPAPKGKK